MNTTITATALSPQQELHLSLIAAQLGVRRETALTEALGTLTEALERDLYIGAEREPGETRLELIEATSGVFAARMKNNATNFAH